MPQVMGAYWRHAGQVERPRVPGRMVSPDADRLDVSPVLSLEQQFPGVPPLADRTQRRSDGTEQRNVPGFAALGSAQDETAAHLGYALAHMQPMPEEIDVTDRERRGFAPTKPA